MDEIRDFERGRGYRTVWFTNFNSGDFFNPNEMNRLSGLAIDSAVQSCIDGTIINN